MARGRLDSSERGATAVEYGFLLALIAGVIVAVVGNLGLAVADLFSRVLNAF